MTKTPNLIIKAGPKAKAHIEQYGFRPKDVKAISAAAGGPKWFVIYHLTRYIATHILPHVKGRVNLLGSSVGAWQMACLSTSDPSAALERLRDRYADEIYYLPISTDEISRGCRSTLEKTFSEDDVSYIINNKKVNLNIFVARGRGILNTNYKYRVYIGLGLNFITNAINRKMVGLLFERHIFSTQMEMPIEQLKSKLSTTLVKLDADKFRDTLMATASIPLVMNGVQNIKGYEQKTFWDGGLTDYHMVLPYKSDGIVLIPHFLPDLAPGWMDKSLKSRRGRGKQLENVIFMHPSEKYVKSLPKGKISTRDDFLEYGNDQGGRAKYWTEISEQGQVMADELDELIKTGKIAEVIQEF
ncbi:MAG: hypothetical protein V3V00_04065 [Saprospiraceae bacterium]